MTRSEPSAAPLHGARTARPYLPVLDVVRIVAVVGVIGVHVLADPVAEGRTGTGWVALRMALSTAVPVFLMMSGALTLAPGAHRKGPRAFLARRAVRILPALVVWSLFYMLVVQRWTGAGPLSAEEMGRRVITGETYTHLYFLWAIAGLYLLAPVLAAFLAEAGEERAQGRRAWVIALAACAWTLVVIAVPVLTEGSAEGSLTPVQRSALTDPLLFLGYFVVGRAALAAPVSRRLGALCLLACVPLVALMTVLIRVPEAEQRLWQQVLMPSYVTPLVVVCSVLLFAGMISWTAPWRVGARAQRVLRELGNATFGVFLVHFAVLVAARVLVPGLGSPTTAAMSGLWALVAVVSFALALPMQRVPGLRLLV